VMCLSKRDLKLLTDSASINSVLVFSYVSCTFGVIDIRILNVSLRENRLVIMNNVAHSFAMSAIAEIIVYNNYVQKRSRLKKH